MFVYTAVVQFGQQMMQCGIPCQQNNFMSLLHLLVKPVPARKTKSKSQEKYFVELNFVVIS